MPHSLPVHPLCELEPAFSRLHDAPGVRRVFAGPRSSIDQCPVYRGNHMARRRWHRAASRPRGLAGCPAFCCVVDELTRKALGARAGRSIDAEPWPGAKNACSERAEPIDVCFGDGPEPIDVCFGHGPEPIDDALAPWCRPRGAGTARIDPGSPSKARSSPRTSGSTRRGGPGHHHGWTPVALILDPSIAYWRCVIADGPHWSGPTWRGSRRFRSPQRLGRSARGFLPAGSSKDRRRCAQRCSSGRRRDVVPKGASA
jgi:hypothetical protein